MNEGNRVGKYLKRGVLVLLGALVIGTGAGWISGSHNARAQASIFGSDASTAAPDFELADLSGSQVQLSKFKGERPVMLYFWATWCPYCVAVKPEVAKLRENVPKDQLEILGINVGGGDSLERVKRFMEAHPAPYPVLFDGSGKVTRAYHVQGIPLFVVIDKQGNIAYKGNALPKDISQYTK